MGKTAFTKSKVKLNFKNETDTETPDTGGDEQGGTEMD